MSSSALMGNFGTGKANLQYASPRLCFLAFLINSMSPDIPAEIIPDIAASEIENNSNFDILLKQQKELLDLQSSVQKSLQMIQKKLKEEKTTKVVKKNKGNLTRIASVSCYNKESATPDKNAQTQSAMHRSKSGTGFSMGTSFKRRVKPNQSFVSHATGYVDYSEVKDEEDSFAPRELATP